MLEDLRTAIVASAWPDALAAALSAWRVHRVPALANLVDVLGARCPQPVPPGKREVHAWWIARAGAYAHTDVTMLAAFANARLGTPIEAEEVRARHLSSNFVRALVGTNPRGLGARALGPGLAFIDRLAFLLDTHLDPRWAPVLADWLSTTPVILTTYGMEVYPSVDLGEIVYGAIARRVGALADARVLPMLQAVRARGQLDAMRGRLLGDAIAAIEKRADVPTPALVEAIAACTTQLGQLAPTRDPVLEAALWAEVARHRDDLAPRVVLGDFLVEHGDPRGELIALQIANTKRAQTQAQRLISQHGKQWLGDLGLLCTRRGTVFRNGMLDEIRVGQLTTPDWAFAAVRGHRELATVRTVIPAVITAAHFVALLDGMAAERVGIEDHAFVLALAATRASWPFRALELGAREASPRWDPNVTLPVLATICPRIEEIAITAALFNSHPPQVCEALPALADMFPRLTRIVLPRAGVENPFTLRHYRPQIEAALLRRHVRVSP